MAVLGNSLGIVKGGACSLYEENATEFSLHLLGGFSVPDVTIGRGGTGRI